MTAVHGDATPVVRRLGLVDYESVWRDMREFVERRDETTPDELWLLQHPAVYTRGLNCSTDPPRATRIPVVQSDRGGQLTYHGPGQVIAYALLDVKRRGLGVKQLVSLLEQSVIQLLGDYGISGERRNKAPGVYVEGRKIAALGIRIRRGCSYHGLSLNIEMDLAPFGDIDPCGFEGLEVTQMRDLGVREDLETIQEKLAARLLGCSLPPGRSGINPHGWGVCRDRPEQSGGSPGPRITHCERRAPNALPASQRHHHRLALRQVDVYRPDLLLVPRPDDVGHRDIAAVAAVLLEHLEQILALVEMLREYIPHQRPESIGGAPHHLDLEAAREIQGIIRVTRAVPITAAC